MFKINLSSFQDSKEFSYELKSGEISFEDAVAIEDGMQIDLRLTKDRDTSVIVEGTINGAIKLNCSRCLEGYSHNVATAFAVIFKEKNHMNDDDRESDIYEYAGNMLDLYEYLRDTLILEIPAKPLCEEECKGLCKVCGKNKNKEECTCEQPG